MIWGKVISFTKNGAETAQKIATLLENKYIIEVYQRGIDQSLNNTRLKRLVQQAMVDCNLIIFVGATGIAVRAIAPYLKGKAFDPAVLVVDECANFVISLISGHLGGANEITEQLAKMLGANAVITTATDIQKKFAIDIWTKENNCVIENTKNIQFISSAILNGDNVGILSDFSIKGELPHGIVRSENTKNGILISLNSNKTPFFNTLNVIPRIIHIGIGCKKNTSKEKIEYAINSTLKKYKIDIRSVKSISSIDLKKNETGILKFCRENNIKFNTFTAQMLNSIEGEFSSSQFVKSITNTDNVCERSAIYSSKNNYLICKKTAFDGVTIAVSMEKWEVIF